MDLTNYTTKSQRIELFEPGDWVESMIGDGGGKPYVWRVENKQFGHKRGEGKFIRLEAARETDMYGTGMNVSVEGPPGTVVVQAIPQR